MHCYRQQTIRKRCQFNQEMHIAFADLEKAFGNIDCQNLWQTMEKRVSKSSNKCH